MGKEIIKKRLEEWLEIWKESIMSKKLPERYILQDNLNEMFGLDKDTFDGNGIRTMDLKRGILLRLNLEIKKLKERK